MRRIHNFQVVAKVDGRDNIISFGPRKKDGGFTLIIYMREKGEITKAVQIQGKVKDMGKALVLIVDGADAYYRLDNSRGYAKGEFTIITER